MPSEPIAHLRRLLRAGGHNDVQQMIRDRDYAIAEWGAVFADPDHLDEDSLARDALWCLDMTTGPEGESLPFAIRLEELRLRLGPAHPSVVAVERTAPEIEAAIRRVHDRVGGSDWHR